MVLRRAVWGVIFRVKLIYMCLQFLLMFTILWRCNWWRSHTKPMGNINFRRPQQTRPMTMKYRRCPNNLAFWAMRVHRANVIMAFAAVVRACWSQRYDNLAAWISPIRPKISHLNWKWLWTMRFYIRVEWPDEIRRPCVCACHDSVSSNCAHHFTIYILSDEICTFAWRWERISVTPKCSIGMVGDGVTLHIRLVDCEN